MKLLAAALLTTTVCLSGPAIAEEPTSTDVAPAAARAHEEPAAEATASEPPATQPAPTQQSVPAAFSPYRSLSDEELRYEFEHTSLGGPIALTVVGGSFSALALPTFLVSGLGALVCATNSVGDCTAVDTVAVVSGISTAVFGTMTIVGVVLLANRSQKRTALKNEMWRRQAEGTSLTLRLSPTYGGSMLTLRGRF